MDIENIIRAHNQVLNEKVDLSPFLAQRLKARLKDPRLKRDSRVVLLKKRVFVYAFLFLMLTLVNLMILNVVQKPATDSIPEFAANVGDFHGDYPGSLSLAFLEVSQWQD